jgi:hypothetical protein
MGLTHLPELKITVQNEDWCVIPKGMTAQMLLASIQDALHHGIH